MCDQDDKFSGEKHFIKTYYDQAKESFANLVAYNMMLLKNNFLLCGGAIGLIVTLLVHLGLRNPTLNIKFCVAFMLPSIVLFLAGLLLCVVEMFWSNQISLLTGQAYIKMGNVFLFPNNATDRLDELKKLGNVFEAKAREFLKRDILHTKLSFAFFIAGVALVIDGILYLLFSNTCWYYFIWVIGLLPAVGTWFVISKYVQKILETKELLEE